MADGRSIHDVAVRLLPARYLTKYRDSLSADLDRLLLPGEETPRSLDEFYLPLHFREMTPAVATPTAAGHKPVDAWDLLFRTPRLAIVGEPGSGKTATLKYMAIALARKKLSDTYINRLTFRHQGESVGQLLPVYVDLGRVDLQADDLAIPLGQVLARYGYPSATGFLRKELREGRCLLLFDGLEALQTPDGAALLSRLLAAYPKALVVVSARATESVSRLPGFSCFELLPFSEGDVRAFLERRLGKAAPAASALLQALERNGALGSLAGNPLLLATLAWAAESDPSPPLRLLELYQPCLELLSGDGETGQKQPGVGHEGNAVALGELARYFHERRQQEFSEQELSDAVSQIRAAAGQASSEYPSLDWLRGSTLLRQRAGKHHGFLRLALQEFLTAKSVVQGKRYSEILRNSMDDAWWQEVIVLATALTGNAADAVEHLKSSSKPNEALFLAASCVAEAPATPLDVTDNLRSALFKILESEEPSYWQEAALRIASLAFQRISDYFPRQLKDGSLEERERAALVMGRVGKTDWAMVPLLGALDPSKPASVRSRVAWALGRMGDKVAVRSLIETLRDSNEQVASEAALALSAIGEPAVPSLIVFLSSEQPLWRLMAVKALGNMGAQAVTPLLHIMQGEKQPDRTVEGAAEALGLLGDPRALPDLVQLLRARGGRLAECAVRALTRMGEPAVPMLIEALPTQSAELQLRTLIVNALVAMGKPSIAPLIQALQHPSTPVRDAAEKALAGIGADASSALVNALRTDNWELRRRIAQVIRQIGDARLAEPLLDVLKDPDSGVRARVAEILGQIGQERAVTSLIDLVQNDPDEFVRRKAMAALADLHSEEAIRPVIQVLNNPQLRDQAVQVLNEIGEESVEPLIAALNESRNVDFQKACAKALEMVGAPGRLEEQSKLIIAQVYSRLYTERPPLDQMVSLLDKIKWWNPAEQLHQAFSTAQELLRVRNLDDLAQCPEQLNWVNSLENPFRPGIRNVLWGLNNVAQNIRLFLQNSGREGQRDSMISALNSMTEIQETIDSQLLGFEKKPFSDIVYCWRALMEEATKNLRGRADLRIVAVRDVLPLDGTSVSAMVVFSLTNLGDSAARNLVATLKPRAREGFDVIGQASQQLYGLGTGMQIYVEFWVKPHGSSEQAYSFEVSYDDDEGPGHFVQTSGQLRFFVVGEEYRPIPRSPYVMGPPVKTTQMFYGRQDAFQWIHENISGTYQQNILVLHGERRMGKTSLLYQLLNNPPTPQHICIFFSLELATTDSMGDLLLDLAIAIDEEVEKLGLPIPDPVEKEFLSSPRRAFQRFFDAVEDALGERRLLIMIDEIDILIAKVQEGLLSSDVFHFMRGLMQHSNKIAFIVTGAYKVREMLKDNQSILFNIAKPYKISYLNEEEARELIVKPVAEFLTYDEMVVEKILRVTACHPYFVQYICDSLLKLAQRMRKNLVYLPDIDVVLQDVIQDNTGVLQNAVYGPLTKPEQKVLAALASVTNDRTILVLPDKVAEVLTKHGLAVETAQLLEALRSLHERDLVDERRVGQTLQYGFKMDLIRMWLSQKDMLLRLSQEAKI